MPTTTSTSTAKTSTTNSITSTVAKISNDSTNLPPAAPITVGSVIPVCNELIGFSVVSNNMTVCNKDASGASRQASEVVLVLV